MAIALLLPTQARANSLTSRDTAGQPVALTSVEPLPKVRTDVVLETASEAVVSGAIAAESSQPTQALDSTVAEVVNADVDLTADTSVDANIDANVVNFLDSNVDDNNNAQTDSQLLLSSSTSRSGYRFAFLDYSSDEIDLNVDQNGPYLNIGFRF